MCKVRSQLRQMVKVRLDAAAEEIFELFERVLVEYEEELRRVQEKSVPRATAGLTVVEQPCVSKEVAPDVSAPVDVVIKQEPEELDDEIQQITITSFPLKSENEEEQELDSTNIKYQLQDLPPQNGSGGETPEAIDLTAVERKKPHACPICGKAYSWKSHLEIHLRVHTGEKPFGCSFCGKRFTKKMYLVIHLRRHTGEKPFSCSVCQDRFISKDSVVKHMTVVHPSLCGVGHRPKHNCSECGKGFTSRSHLEMHLRVHTGEKPFQCGECGKRFTQKATMLGHMTRHTGERPFTCPVCQKSFRQKNHVQKHMNIHLREFSLSQEQQQQVTGRPLFLYQHQDYGQNFRDQQGRDFRDQDRDIREQQGRDFRDQDRDIREQQGRDFRDQNRDFREQQGRDFRDQDRDFREQQGRDFRDQDRDFREQQGLEFGHRIHMFNYGT